jgi:hypothetical protein
MTDGGDVDAAPMDAGTDAAMDADVDAGTPDAGPPACDPAHVLALTSDYMTGAEGALFDPMAGTSETLGTLADQDSAPAFAGCRSFVLERGIGHLLVLDGVTTGADVDLNEAGVTDSYMANPQAVISISDTEVWVPLAARNAIVRVDPTATADSALLGEIDLSVYVDAADTDGTVEPSAGVVAGGRVYLPLGRYFFDSSFAIQFDAGSVIAVLDASTGAPIDMDDAMDGVQGLAVGNNPWRGLRYDADSDTLWVAASGDSFAIDGALQSGDVAATGTPADLLTETTLGAELNGFAVVSPTRVYVLAGSDLVVWDGVAGSTPGASIASGVDGLLLVGDTLFTWSRMGDGIGLHTFDAATGAETTPASGAFNFGSFPITGLAPAP